MADFRAIGAVADAVKRLLEQAWSAAPFNGSALQFEVYQGKDFKAPMTAGVSVFVYQVTVSHTQRTLPPALPHHRRPLPIEMWMLLTAWAQDASMEHQLLGWAMRVIDDNPVVSSGFLNASAAGVFRPEETVELAPGELANHDVFELWQVLPSSLQLSVPYLARVVRLESDLVVPDAGPVRVRELQFGAVPVA